MEMDLPNMGVPAELAARMSMAEQHEYLRSKFSRRGLIRGGALAAGAVASMPLLAGTANAAQGGSQGGDSQGAPAYYGRPGSGAVNGALVAPYGRHLAFGADPSSQFRVAWQTPVPVNRPYLRFGRSPLELGHKISAETRALHTPALVTTGAAVDQFYHHVAIDHLEPETTYFYGVGHDGFDPAAVQNAGTLGTFTTGPRPRRHGGDAAEPFTFTAFGDQGVSYHALGNDSVILAQNPAFHLHAGDIAYGDPAGQGLPADGSQYDARTWDSFLFQTESVAKTVPWMVSVGNHDMEAWYSPNGYGGDEARFDFIANGPDPVNAPGIYSFVYGNVAVISLDPNDVSYEIPANYNITGGKQTQWLEQQLSDFRRRSDVDFIVVFFHHCAFSTTNQHASEGGVRDQWVPLFEQHKVDLVINGHNHVYERTDAIANNAVKKALPAGSTHYPADGGVVYATAGAAGRSLYSFPVPDSYEGNVSSLDSVATYHWVKGGGKVTETVGWSRARYTGYSFLRVDATPARAGRTTTLKVTALAESGAQLDHFTIERTAGKH
ncbi:metallophosphoesterase [Catenulispora yoronensis]|uniref:Metallophosphoesterase n=2 Tax=Catenulispora yoronensis TaxID=450799 RepID=A0ABN2TWN6_9ACTN